jgi:predicted RNase H-like HicB family nuclease
MLDSVQEAKLMKVVFIVDRDEETGGYTASWDDPAGGGISTQAETLAELSNAIREAIKCHFADRPLPRVATLHFEHDPELQLA